MPLTLSKTPVLLCLFLGVCGIISCQNTSLNSAKLLHDESKVIEDSGLVITYNPPPAEALTVPEYVAWIKTNIGVTYAAMENNQVSINWIYKPQVLEAATSVFGSALTKESFEQAFEAKEGYHYLVFEYLDKVQSVNKGSEEKKELINKIKESFVFIKNENDTLTNPIVESFPATLLNQPHTFLILLPNPESAINAKFIGNLFGIEDLQITIKKKHINSFPEIKI